MSATAQDVPDSGLFLRVFPSIMLPMFLAAVDQTIVAASLPAIAGSLGDVSRISWVVVSYLIATTIAAPVYGRLGDVLGRKRLMFVALPLFMGASVLCALATSIPMLSAARVLQGLGGGGLMTLSQALIGESVPARQRGKYQGYLSATFVSASTFGPVAGGWLTQRYGWPSVFLVNLPLGALAILLVLRLPAGQPGGGRLQFDYLGVLLFGAVVGPLLLAIEQAQQFNAAKLPSILSLGALAVGSLVLLIRQERRTPAPLLPIKLLRNPSIWRTDLMAALVGGSMISLISFLPMYLQVVRGAGPAEVGVLLLPLTAGIGFGALFTGRMIAATGRTAIFPSCGLVVAVASLTLLALFAPSLTTRELSWSFVIVSLSLGTAMPVVQMTVQSVAGPKMLGAASASVQFSRSVGAALGTAIVGAVLFALLAAQDFLHCSEVRRPRPTRPRRSRRAPIRARSRGPGRNSRRFPRRIPVHRRIHDGGAAARVVDSGAADLTGRRLVVVSALGIGQIFAWGSSYYLMAVLAAPIRADTGWPLSWIVGALSAGLLISGLVSPRVGVLIERHGGRPVLAASAIVLAAGLVLMVLAPSLPWFVAAWVVIGVGMGAGLYDAAFSALGRLYGEDARRAIGQVTLYGGFSSSVGWPLNAFLETHIGWRGACLVYAAIQVGLMLPMYLICVPREASRRPERGAPVVATASAASPGDRAIFAILAAGLTLASMIMTVISVHLMTLLGARGMALGVAVGLGALLGPAQVGARVLEMAFGRGLHPVWSLVASAALVAAGIAWLWLAPATAASVGFGIVAYGSGSGIRTIARGTVPLAFFGSEGYAVLMGRLAFPTLIATAAAPSIGALLIERIGSSATLAAITGAAVVNIALAAALVPYAINRARPAPLP